MMLFAIWLIVAAQQPATVTRCAACHLANMPNVPGAAHLGEWQRSAHAKKNVGCDQCHGGNPWTFEPREAHRGVVGPASPASPVHRANLANTCSRCHERNALAFSTTLHGTLVQIDERRAPTCTTCHGVMSARVPAPDAVEQKCRACHPAGSARGEYPAIMRVAIEALNVQRERADALEDLLQRIPDYNTRVTQLIALYDTRTLLKQAVAAVHRIDPQTVTEQTRAAAVRLDALTAAAADFRQPGA